MDILNFFGRKQIAEYFKEMGVKAHCQDSLSDNKLHYTNHFILTLLVDLVVNSILGFLKFARAGLIIKIFFVALSKISGL